MCACSPPTCPSTRADVLGTTAAIRRTLADAGPVSIGRFHVAERAEPAVVVAAKVPSPVEIHESQGSGLEIWSKPFAEIKSFGRDMGTTGEGGYVKFRTDRLLPTGEVWTIGTPA